MMEKLRALDLHYADVEARLSAPETYEDPALVARLNKEQRELEPVVMAYRAYQRRRQDLEDAEALMGDPDMKELAQEEYQQAREELARLEGERCPSMDRAADAFAALLAGAAEEEPDPVRRRVLEQLLYHLGRWIYLVDAADDLKKDVKSGSYNPLVYRFHAEGGTLTAEDRAALAATLDSSVRTMAAAFELADFGPWRAIIESVVYEGLYAVGAAVLNGTFRKGHRRKQRKAGA